MIRRTGPALVAALAIALAAAQPAAATTKAIWGPVEMQDHTSAFAIYHQLHVKVFEIQLSWAQVATSRPTDPRNPNDPAYHWPKVACCASLPEAISEGARYRIKIAVMVKNTPAWANGGQGPIVAPTNPADYADFVYAAAHEYPSVHMWMIWGEPDRSDSFLPARPAGAAIYARMLDASYVALKASSRHNIVIGGMTHFPAPVSWLNEMKLPNGKPPRLDWWGHNPFSGRFPNIRGKPRGPIRDFDDIDTFHSEVDRVYKSIHRRPKLWISEWTVQSDHSSFAFPFYVSRREQARWLTAAYKIVDRLKYVAGMGWFNLQDSPGPRGETTGLLTSDGRRKPAFYAYRRAR